MSHRHILSKQEDKGCVCITLLMNASRMLLCRGMRMGGGGRRVVWGWGTSQAVSSLLTLIATLSISLSHCPLLSKHAHFVDYTRKDAMHEMVLKHY